jgi:hypothetical protein
MLPVVSMSCIQQQETRLACYSRRAAVNRVTCMSGHTVLSVERRDNLEILVPERFLTIERIWYHWSARRLTPTDECPILFRPPVLPI